MKVDELDSFLRKITKNEEKHLNDPNALSERYNTIPITIIKDKEVYEFSFDSVLKEGNISIIKESRFTPIPLHRHSVIEINYVYSGTCTQLINGHSVVLNTGDVCLLDRNTPHEVLALSKDDIVITIDMTKKYFTDGFLQKMSTNGIISRFLVQALQDDTDKKSFMVFRNENDEELRLLFERLMCEYFGSNKSNEVVDAWMIITLSRLLNNFIENDHSNIHTESPNKILEVLQYLEANYRTATLSNTAKVFGFNSNYFSSYLKKHTGQTFQNLIIQKKLTEFCFYLVNTDTPIYELINDMGYENQGFFYKKFRETYGKNPKDYRKLHSNSASMFRQDL